MKSLAKRISTGIQGLDTILNGGYADSSLILLKGEPGTGKTIFGLSFAHAVLAAGEGVVVATCDEHPDSLVAYLDSMNMEGSKYAAEGRLQFLDFRPYLEETVVGEYDLAILQLRIKKAIESAGSNRLVIDSLENLHLAMKGNTFRPEMMSLFQWIRDTEITALITAGEHHESGAIHAFEDYAVDCVIQLKQHLESRLMTRYLRVIKQRGSAHGTNEYPFILTNRGASLIPVTDANLTAKVSDTRIGTGLEKLDQMLGGSGYYRGTTLMISGSAGTGKSILAATLLSESLRQGLPALYLALEESPDEVIRNIRSVNVDLSPYVDSGLLLMKSTRPAEMGLENHLIQIAQLAQDAGAKLVVIDPISAFSDMGSPLEVKMMLMRFTNHMKNQRITLLFTDLTSTKAETSDLYVSSLVDTWILLRQIERNGELNRLLYLVKGRGLATSNQVKEFCLTNHGVKIEDPYIGPGGMVVGTEKVTREQEDTAQEKLWIGELQKMQTEMKVIEQTYQEKLTKIQALRQKDEYELSIEIERLQERIQQAVHHRAIRKELRE